MLVFSAALHHMHRRWTRHPGVWTHPDSHMQALALTPLSFLRPFGLLSYSVLTCLAGSPRARARVWQEKYMFFGQDVRPFMYCSMPGWPGLSM